MAQVKVHFEYTVNVDEEHFVALRDWVHESDETLNLEEIGYGEIAVHLIEATHVGDMDDNVELSDYTVEVL